MERNELVSAILDLFDKAENVKKETVVIEKEINRALTFGEQMFIEYGKKALMEKVLYSWKTVSAKRQDDDSIKFTTFPEYIKETVQRGSIPDNISYSEFLTIMKDDLMEKYEGLKAKALEQLLATEEAKKKEPKENEDA